MANEANKIGVRPSILRFCFNVEAYMARPGGPALNSRDREVVDTGLKMTGEVRRTGIIMSALRALLSLMVVNPDLTVGAI